MNNTLVNGIISQTSNSIIINNTIDTGIGFYILNNSNITIQNNIYNNLMYIIDSSINNNISIDKNSHLLQTYDTTISAALNDNMETFNGKNNSLLNIFYNVSDLSNSTLFSPIKNTGLSINTEYIWSAKFGNDSGSAFGYHWSDFGICLAQNRNNQFTRFTHRYN